MQKDWHVWRYGRDQLRRQMRRNRVLAEAITSFREVYTTNILGVVSNGTSDYSRVTFLVELGTDQKQLRAVLAEARWEADERNAWCVYLAMPGSLKTSDQHVRLLNLLQGLVQDKAFRETADTLWLCFSREPAMDMRTGLQKRGFMPYQSLPAGYTTAASVQFWRADLYGQVLSLRGR